MSLITENPRITDVLVMERGETFNYVRDQITLASGGAACVIGQVLGSATIGGGTSAAKSGGNTGVGTLTLDVTTPILANAKVGIYTVRVLAVGTFIVTDPKGVIVGDAAYGAGATVTFANQIKFAFHDDGSTHYVAGDGFDITIAAGTGKWAQVAPAATDGTQNAAGICVEAANPTSADAISVAVTRGPAAIKVNGLTWTAGMTTPQKTAALAQLQALGIVQRSDYGV